VPAIAGFYLCRAIVRAADFGSIVLITCPVTTQAV
jgi:hypothetical protein